MKYFKYNTEFLKYLKKEDFFYFEKPKIFDQNIKKYFIDGEYEVLNKFKLIDKN